MKLDQILRELKENHHGEFTFEKVPSQCIRTKKKYPAEEYVSYHEEGSSTIEARCLCPLELIWVDQTNGEPVMTEIDDTVLELGGVEDAYFDDADFISASDHNEFPENDVMMDLRRRILVAVGL